ncbi:MAG TPA: tetratricopeptide repeat protein [Thermoanaerobaculia bacterium]|nr:tetratricopeptide repeat protein [Thermoanaerobaculia bacterium]
MSKPTVFVSYSRHDREWKDRLVQHLEVLEREGLLDVWDDSRIPVSSDWLPEIEGAIARARVAVLLVSVDFLGSDFIRKKEVPEFLARRRNEGLHVFPVIVRPCTWDQVEALASIQARPRDGKVLTDFRGSRAERELVEIAREILRLAEAAPAASAMVSPKSTTTALLHQLPAPPADFVGRTEDLAALRASVKKGGATICGLQGQGGVGKTALALVLAQEMAADFPDAQIFLDLQGVSERPLSTSEAMAHVVRSFDPEAKLPEGPQLAVVYRDILACKRVLLLMDNASGPDQVAPLLPPAACALLVTSRQKFTLPGLAVRDLELLPEKDACELLLAIAPQIGGRAVEIARLCGFLPFALRIAAGTLVERPDLSVEAFEKRLGRGKELATMGEKVLGIGVSLLTAAFQRRYCHLAVFAGDFDAPAAGALWGLDEDETDETLGAFVRGSLLEGKSGRYKLHDLARAFVASRLTEEQRAQGELRHAEHYCGVLEEADRLYQQGNEHILAGLALFDRERHQIAAGQAWAAEKFHEWEEAARLASEYPEVGWYVLDLRLTPRQWIAWLEAGREGARQTSDRAAEGRHLGTLGIAYASLGETRRAIETYEQCLAILREIGDRSDEGITLGNLGNVYRNLGETRRAIETYEQCLAVLREIGDRRGEGTVLGNLGSAYANLGETQRAIEYHEHYLAIAQEIGDRRGEGTALGNLGCAYANLGETQHAIKYHEQYLAIAHEIGDRRGEGIASGNLGSTYADLGETRRAIEYQEHYLAIAREIGDRRGEGIASWNLGLAYETLGEFARAVELTQIRVDFEREFGHQDAEKHAARVEAIRARLAG